MPVLAMAASLNGNTLLQQLENGITLGAMYALVALGYTLVYGIIELINFAHGDVLMWSTMIMLLVVEHFGWTTALNGFSLIGALALLLVMGMLFAGVLNVVIERLAYRPLRHAPRLAPLIAAIGVSFVLENVAQLWRGSGQLLFPNIFPLGGFNIGSVSVQYFHVFIILTSLALMFLLNWFIRATKLGRAMRATAQDPEAASLMGVNINRTIAITFLIGGALAGAAGLFNSMYTSTAWYFAGFQLGLIAFTAAVLGGIGNIYGAVVGGFLIGIIEAIATQVIPNGSGWADPVVFAILVLVLVFRPSGILGQQVPDKA